MTPEEIEAIVGGFHGDPFRVLGPHKVDTEEHKGWEVRSFLPHVNEAALLLGGTKIRMMKEHPHGLYVGRLKSEPIGYRMWARLWDGSEQEWEDPYRFLPSITDYDLFLHGEGNLFASYESLGAHLIEMDGVPGVRFAVWAPSAIVVSVVGDFNGWDTRRHPMRLRNNGVWELFIPGVEEGAPYKYHIHSHARGYQQGKADPYGFGMEAPPKSASVVRNINRYQWHDQAWMERRGHTDWLKQPVSMYEVHLESWMRGPDGQPLSYRELADALVTYVKRLGYTHIELLPVAEHPFSGSWGYQLIGYFAPTARFGTPEDFMHLIDRCHQEGIGVILDWVPGHFPKDAHGLAYFDGTALYEHEDWRIGEHREWGTLIFNYGRNEVRNFLISNALFWLKKYHIDGLRVDAVASMLYLDYGRKEGEWIPNRYGGNENLEAIDFLRRFNELAHEMPGAITIAEESTSFPGVSKPVYLNGLGFTMKWNMGWMHDMLNYFSKDPIHRKYHHHNITFSLLYAFSENFVLPISHDEVVYGKRSVLGKMPGDEWQRFANMRAFLGYMYGHPGKKLIFMSSEIGQYDEWNHDASVQWDLLNFDPHRKLQDMVRELNHFYCSQPALYQIDYHWSGFDWVDIQDIDSSIISFVRRAENQDDSLLFCCNFTPAVRHNYRVGVPHAGFYAEAFNTDWERFGGSNVNNGEGVHSDPHPAHGRDNSIAFTVPPLAVIVFKRR